jgi:hypothetical protein
MDKYQVETPDNFKRNYQPIKFLLVKGTDLVSNKL